MGCCISKYKPKKHFNNQDFSNQIVQDKLVISQFAPKTPQIINSSNKISPSPPSPINYTTSSFSSFSCISSSTTSSSHAIKSSCSSISSSKDPSTFSNEFLWSCYKENPHVIQINSIKERSQFLARADLQARKLNPSATRVDAIPTQQKRVRPNSPNVDKSMKQKSFRREHEVVNYSPHTTVPMRALRSPSPRRRFNGESNRGISTIMSDDMHSKQIVNATKVTNVANSVSSALSKQNIRHFSPRIISTSSKIHPALMNKETCIHRITSKIDEIAVQETLAREENEAARMEDIENPLISLDCFIFI